MGAVADTLTWDDADEIALILRERFPETDPETVSDLEIARWVREIPTLDGEPASATRFPQQLEAIRAAWGRG